MSESVVKVFVSQVMRGKTRAEIEAERQAVLKVLPGGCEYEIMPLADDPPPEYDRDVWYITKSLESMTQADVFVFCDGWETAPGCVIEDVFYKGYIKYAPRIDI